MNPEGQERQPSETALLPEKEFWERVPRATYRLQFHPGFAFRDAQDLLPYLDDLGISDCYVSPIFKPCFDESHGYDVCSHSQLNPAIGSPEDFQMLSRKIRERSMGLILDFVPNHMGIAGDRNVWWMDVLENGPSSKFSYFFDIDWHPVKPELENKVLLPILEDPYGRVLESGKFRLTLEEGAFFLNYYRNKLPVAPRSYIRILGHALRNLEKILGKDNLHLQEMQSILTALSHLPHRTELTEEKLEERFREKEVIKRRIAALSQAGPEFQTAIHDTIRFFNGAAGDPRSFDPLDALLKDQAYRPAFWRVASDEINYRRFFDINNLAAIRVEQAEVFRETHRLLLQLLSRGEITGLRIDHPDGLWNPTEYFFHLQKSFAAQMHGKGKGDSARVHMRGGPHARSGETKENEIPGAKDPGSTGRHLYIVAEKILGDGEPLPPEWAIRGTTGYEFLNLVNGLFVDGRNERAFDNIYSQFTGVAIAFANIVNSSKKMIMLVSLASEVHALAHQLERIIENSRRYRDFTLNGLTFVLREIIACLPVYRTYINETRKVTSRDQVCIEAAVEEAKRRNPRTAEAIFDFVGDTLLLRTLPDFPEEDQSKLIRFVMKFQQITGPVMAKGMEDTAFYIYNRLASLNEVGGHPGRFGVSVADFHKQNAERLKNWPHSLLATSTHDTKRGEDVRARLDILSEMPGEWRLALSRWSKWNAAKKTLVDGELAPDPNDEYLFYQTLLGAWPEEEVTETGLAQFRERIAGYMLKATLEAKVHTSWVNPNEEYHAALENFVSRVLEHTGKNRFFHSLESFRRRVAYFGRFNSLAQTLLKLTCPGVPDLYQGAELWDLNLVDPDNRRPVDYSRRRDILNDLRKRAAREKSHLFPLIKELLATPGNGRIKLYLIYRVLEFRRLYPELFVLGEYHPLEVVGEKKDHAVAFARTREKKTLIVLVPRLVVGLTGGVEHPPLGDECWKDTRVSVPSSWKGRIFRNLFTSEEVQGEEKRGICGFGAGSALRSFPVGAWESTGNLR